MKFISSRLIKLEFFPGLAKILLPPETLRVEESNFQQSLLVQLIQYRTFLILEFRVFTLILFISFLIFLTKKFDSSCLSSFLPTSFISERTSSNVFGFKSIKTGFLSIKLS